MRRSIHRGLLPVMLVVLTGWACNNNSSSSTPTQPTQTVTETFSGNLNQNGAATYPFVAQASGTVTATLTSVGPDSTLVIGMSLGTWNGTACTIVIANDNATQGSALSGSLSSSGNFCVRVYDVGHIVDPASFTVAIVHP